MNMKKNIILCGLTLFLTGCEPLYDPVRSDDIPASPGSVWNRESFTVKKTADHPFDASNLSGTMSLSQLLDIALYNNPSTRASWHASRAAAYGYRASLSAYYPAIDYTANLDAQTFKGSTFASSGSGIISTNGNTSATTSSGAVISNGTLTKPAFSTNLFNDLSLTYLLLDFGGRDATADISLQALYASNWQHDYTMQQVMLSVLTAYPSYLGNKGLVEGYQQDLKDAEVAVKAAKTMHNAGLATLTDVLSAQSTLELTRTNLYQSIASEKTSFGEILIAIGLPPDTDISVDSLPQELPVIDISGDVSSLLDLAKQKRPDLGIAIASIKQQEAQLALSYSNSMPVISLNANWNQVRFISPRKPSGYNEIATIELSCPLFEGYYFFNQQRQLRAQIEEAMADLDVQLATVASQVITNYYSFKGAEAALPSSEAAVEFSQRAYRGFVIQYKTGTASITDVLTALTTLSNARAQQVLVRTQWASALASLAFSVGILDEDSGSWSKPPKQLSQIPIRDNK
jgi:outer membrane protein